MSGGDTDGSVTGGGASERLIRLLGGDEIAWLVDRARHRLEQGRPPTGTVTLTAATPAQRRAAEALLGRRAGAGSSLSVSLDEVDRILRASGVTADGLREAVVRLRGPIRDLSGEKAARTAAWERAFTRLDTLVANRPELSGWRSWLESTGLVRRLAATAGEARTLLDRLSAVLERLPSPGTPLGRLAAETCGDAHGLDEGRPLATLALSAARALSGLPYAGESGADARRSVWAAVGVHLDDLSSLVLCLGLPGDDRSPTGRMLNAARAAGEPCVLTLRQLRRHESPLPADLVRICENPVVVAAAADELGASCPPLICGGGRPSTAVWRLLDLLAAGGATFAYHGDFDWGGIAIASSVHERLGFQPWRFDAASYQAVPSSAPLSGQARPTPWDPALTVAMERRGVRVEEELVLAELIADLVPKRHGAES
ncbi:TIGR02679 family protein [Nonomuraea phyllanthi]|uniref:TIGR02679 family protein n=1 Tax=Nonomuraea phyllanthi TaxID=2219224 RepID=A0A5C4WIC9_9ACTN|nr:TIGR02679 family protein [Nonomuraea phyllanthi]KAB8194285.1 TIGR02679 family protein [Nonomuraea phyllanthi]QFY07887.1 TIGR02679 family protein [Nonomuraea phyllanthi]